MMNKKNTVIFDLDGTLLDTLQDLSESVRYVQAKKGCALHTNEQVRAHVGNGLKVLMDLSFPKETSKEERKDCLAMFREHYGKHCNDATAPYDGIIELLQKLNDRGYRLAIVSNKPDFAVKELNQIYFSDNISIAIGEKEEEGIRRKPAPDTVQEALKQLGSPVEEAVYVGDSEVDIATARNCGMDCILCEWGFRDREILEKEGAKRFAKKAEDILTILEEGF